MIVALTLFALLLLNWGDRYVHGLPDQAAGEIQFRIVLTAVLLYALLIAIPFVPGVEVGIAIMMLRGPDIAPLVYLGTVSGLSSAFLLGRFVSYDWLQRFFRDLRLTRINRFLERTKHLNQRQRIDYFFDLLPHWVAHLTVRSRYLMLAALFNLPGNAVIGGGGGIALLAGFSRLFSTMGALVTIALAVSPVPIMVFFWGTDILATK